MSESPCKKRIVIIGAGFAGLSAARTLRKADAEIFLIDRRNHHVFKPLLYQVATAALSPAQIAQPIRAIMRKRGDMTMRQQPLRDIARVLAIIFDNETAPDRSGKRR